MPTEPAASFRARESGAGNFSEFANERGGCTVEAIDRILVAVIVDPLRQLLGLLSARHINLGVRPVLVIGSQIAERPCGHGSGIDGIASSTFSPRIAGEVTLSQYGQILRGRLYCQREQHRGGHNGPLYPRLHLPSFQRNRIRCGSSQGLTTSAAKWLKGDDIAPLDGCTGVYVDGQYPVGHRLLGCLQDCARNGYS
jgi:hypothetical protein